MIHLRIPFSILAGALTLAGASCSTFGEDTSAASSEEAGVDANAPTEDASGADAGIPPCPEGALLCDHFERSADMLTGPWNASTFGDTRVVLYLDPLTAKTGTTSFRARDQGNGGTGALTLDVTQDAPIRIEFDIRLSQKQTLSTVLMQYLFNDSSTSVNISLEAGGIKISEQLLITGTGDNRYADTPPLALEPNEWTHVIFTLDSARLAVLRLPDKSLVAQRKITNPTTAANAVRLGLPYVISHADMPAFDVWYDDVVITR